MQHFIGRIGKAKSGIQQFGQISVGQRLVGGKDERFDMRDQRAGVGDAIFACGKLVFIRVVSAIFQDILILQTGNCKNTQVQAKQGK
jgi:hypothetical protein